MDFDALIELVKEQQGIDLSEVLTTADQIKRPEKALEDQAIIDFNTRNPMAGGGMLVQPNADGSRPGYAEEKYVTPQRRTGAEGFQGQKFISVKDPTYSDGRKRVKTPEYEKYLKIELEKSKKRPDRYTKGNIRREPGLLRIAEAMQQADINDDAEFMMPNKKAIKTREKDFNRKMKIFKKGMLEASDIVYINNLEKNFDDVIFIADQLGESPDWVLDKLDERTNFRNFSRGEKDILKQDPKYKKPRNDYLKVENWIQKNAKKYSKPETFENALIKRFGKDNQFIKDMRSNKEFVQTYFSDDFTKTMLNRTTTKSRSKPSHLKEFIKSSLYNFNPKIKNAVTQEIKNIFNAENLPKLRTEARKLLNNNKLLSTFGLNKAITGPYAKVIQAEIGQQLWSDITNFRQHRVGTQEMLKAFEQIVAEEFKPMFAESAKAISFSKNNEWGKAKEILGLADNIAWDHKVPSSVIDKGYADIVEYTKVNPTTENFNLRIKNAQFDRPINKLITKFEKATTLDAKAKIKNEMDIIKNNFNQKYGGYLDDVSINLDPQGNLKFSSSADPLSMKDNRIQMLGKSMVQEGTLKQGSPLYNKLMKFCPRAAKSNGGEAVTCTLDEAMDGLVKESEQFKSGKMSEAQAKKTAQKIRAVARVGTGSTLAGLLGPYGLSGEVVIDGGLIANRMLSDGDTYKESLSKSLLKYAMPKDARERLEKETDRNTMILGTDTSGLSADFADALKKDADLKQKYENYLKVNQEDVSSLDDPYSSGTTPMFSTGDKNKALREVLEALERSEPTYGKNIYNVLKLGSPEQQAFAAKEEVFDAKKMQNRMDYDKKILGPLKDLFGTGFYSPAQLKQLELKADRDTKAIGESQYGMPPSQSSALQRFGDVAQLGVANLAKGGRAGFKTGSVRKGVLSLIDDSVKKTPKDITSDLTELIKETLDKDFLDKKDRIVDTLNTKSARERKKYSYNQKVQEEPSQLNFYDDIVQSNFKDKTGPFFDRRKKAGGGILKQAGDSSGPPPESGPNSQGLQGLMKRGIKI